jgi:DNA-binding LytR/AlgR family response regulator
MRIAICEDEPKMQSRLEGAIKDWAEVRKINVDILCYPNAEAFLMAWPEVLFDLSFLDVQMKGMTGIELAEYIRKTDEHMLIVFVTSFSQYVLKGFDVNALHYLIKPVSAAKLLPVLDKAQMIWKSRQDAFIVVSNGSGQLKLPYSDIIYISMSSHTATIHTANNSFEIRKTAEELEELLPSYFTRCHRSYIVNLFKIDCVYKDYALLSDGSKVNLSRNNSKQVSDAFVRLHIGRLT